VHHLSLWEVLGSIKVLILGLIYFGFSSVLYGMQFWLPQIVKGFGFSNVQTGFVIAIPYLFGAIAMILGALHFDRPHERVWHVALPLFLTAIALDVAGYVDYPIVIMLAMIVASIGIFSSFGAFWALPTAWLSGTAAAGGIALINSIGNLAGFGGPYLIGWVKETTGSSLTGLLVLAIVPLISGWLVPIGDPASAGEFSSAMPANQN
jgi:ACS family tartrate transporter-like MFS transporter